MKPHFEQINNTHQHSFLCRKFLLHHFDTKYHFHPEYELTLIESSSGKRFVGNSIESFGPGDLVLIGKQVPHCWLNDGQLPENHIASSIVVQFLEHFMGEQFMASPEMMQIARMLRNAERGIRFLPEVAAYAGPCMQEMIALPPFERLMRLMQLLQQLASEERFVLLNSEQHMFPLSEEDCNRIQAVYDFVRLNFNEEVRLEQVAELVYMTTTSFCRYFKKITRKTFSRFLIEYRMEYARTQLIQTDKSITEICYESGFRNIAHFNQQFRLLNDAAPRQYRKKFRDMSGYA